MLKDSINNEYFDWIYDLVCHDRYSKDISYRKILMLLHNTPFRYIIPMDENRLNDGLNLRYRFVNAEGYDGHMSEYIDIPCSVLEMMVALAIRCEETIMDDARIGDRTEQWFWIMMTSLGLGSMTDDRFNKFKATEIIETFLDRNYEKNGKGGLFTIKNCEDDLRNIEIWWQLCWYLDSFE